MNSAAQTNLAETALYLEIYSARLARSKAVGNPMFRAANERVSAAYVALQLLRAGVQVAA